MCQTSGNTEPNPIFGSCEPCPGQLPATFVMPAPGERMTSVRLSDDHVTLTSPSDDGDIVRLARLDDYRGLVISVAHDGDREVASVILRHDDDTLSVPLHRVSHDHEISDLMRAWEIWSDALALDRYVEMADGSLEPVPTASMRRPAPVAHAAPRRSNRHFRTGRPSLLGHCATILPGRRSEQVAHP